MLLFVDIKLSFPGHEQLKLLQPYLAEEFKKELSLWNPPGVQESISNNSSKALMYNRSLYVPIQVLTNPLLLSSIVLIPSKIFTLLSADAAEPLYFIQRIIVIALVKKR